MHRLFLDSDIILDLFAKRAPFYISAAHLFTLLEQREAEGFTSPIVFANLHYILKKLKSTEIAMKRLRQLRTLVGVLPVDEQVIDLALNSHFKDFEDAIQHQSALRQNLDFILTRNTKDYKRSQIPVMTAEEYLNLWKASR